MISRLGGALEATKIEALSKYVQKNQNDITASRREHRSQVYIQQTPITARACV